MTRMTKFAAMALLLVFMTSACSEFIRATPDGWDNTALETDVRSSVTAALPAKTFALEIKVDNGNVTLSGHAASETDRQTIGRTAAAVKGVKSVLNNVRVE